MSNNDKAISISFERLRSSGGQSFGCGTKYCRRALQWKHCLCHIWVGSVCSNEEIIKSRVISIPNFSHSHQELYLHQCWKSCAKRNRFGGGKPVSLSISSPGNVRLAGNLNLFLTLARSSSTRLRYSFLAAAVAATEGVNLHFKIGAQAA